ncbi:hypothetical protein B2J88_39060 [Rhodococcus sp. SRB_17]|uniref:lysozyme inhibitor LprI family protein n=1 Tax=Acidovorax sp. SRB_24 TaxID=1962700 RepID=UPI00145D6082|nr:lysozyme inhibitor LprI family protein [Acidovorax sp. SRB_24]NMM76491.1 hypothetical protein [Acidovorax sp. SRB_24]NMM90267.1 hypothetical protein [Rhodococcus sp. SRB_17]
MARALLCSGAVLAGAAAWAQAGDRCDPQGSTAQVNACAVRDFQAADSALNIRYLAVMQSLPAGRRTALRQQHNGWIKGRAARCKSAHRAQEGQSDWPRLYHQCLTQATEERRPALEHWLQP